MKIKEWNHQEAVDEAEEEEEDALSLCDLPIHSGVSEWEKFSESQSSSSASSSSSGKSEFFEFFSEEWNKPARSNLPPEKIIFCGKEIPPKDPLPDNDEKCRKSKTRRKSSRKDCDGEPAESKVLALRESEPPPSPLWRSRWFLFLFGMDGRFPKQMDLKDMKNRQSRKTPSSPLQAPEYRGGNRLRWMIRTLSCGDSDGQVHAQAIVKASIGCIAQM